MHRVNTRIFATVQKDKDYCVSNCFYNHKKYFAMKLHREKEFNFEAPWGNIAGVTWGEPSNPPALLVHGKLDVCTGFRPLVSLLPENFFYVAIDVPGNGRSDQLPRGVRYTVLDLVPTVVQVKQHFNWDKFIYIGHSLGCLIGKLFNIAFPGHITRVIELDPVPAHHTWPTTREDLRAWYHRYYDSYNEDRYNKFHGGPDTAPRYSYKKAQELIMKTRNMTEEASTHVLERCLETAENGLFRFTYDQRMKEVTVLPFSREMLKEIYTSATTPTFAVIAQGEIDNGSYKNVAFITDESAWPNKNYKCKVVQGGHDIHIYNPQCLAADLTKFLLEHFKSKL